MDVRLIHVCFPIFKYFLCNQIKMLEGQRGGRKRTCRKCHRAHRGGRKHTCRRGGRKTRHDRCRVCRGGQSGNTQAQNQELFDVTVGAQMDSANHSFALPDM